MSNKCAVLGQIPGKQVLSAPGAPKVRKLMFKSDYYLYFFSATDIFNWLALKKVIISFEDFHSHTPLVSASASFSFVGT